MLKKIYMQYNVDSQLCSIFKNSITLYHNIYLFMMAIENVQDPDLNVDIMDKNQIVSIWSLDSFKPKAKLEFDTIEQEDNFYDQYWQYYDKRWEEAPKVRLSISDWEGLQKKWEEIKKLKPLYVMLTLDDSGPLDKVEIIAKNELTDDDWANIKMEHEKFLKYQKAKDLYIQNHPDHSDEWRGPQDDEYEADIMKYYEKE